MLDKKFAETLLKAIVYTYESEICVALVKENDYQEIRSAFADLIIILTRLVLDIRYCSKSTCPCSPETELKNHFYIFKDHFEKHLREYDYLMLKDLVEEVKKGA